MVTATKQTQQESTPKLLDQSLANVDRVMGALSEAGKGYSVNTLKATRRYLVDMSRRFSEVLSDPLPYDMLDSMGSGYADGRTDASTELFHKVAEL